MVPVQNAKAVGSSQAPLASPQLSLVTVYTGPPHPPAKPVTIFFTWEAMVSVTHVRLIAQSVPADLLVPNVPQGIFCTRVKAV
jgi:hypothetical protein